MESLLRRIAAKMQQDAVSGPTGAPLPGKSRPEICSQSEFQKSAGLGCGAVPFHSAPLHSSTPQGCTLLEFLPHLGLGYRASDTSRKALTSACAF